MDNNEKLECIMEGMDCEASILTDAVPDQLGETPNPPPPPSVPAGTPATPQPAAPTTLTPMTAPPTLMPAYLYSQPGTGSQGQMQNLRPAGVLKRKRHEQQDEDRPYIKKPPNAFMLFLKEQRAKVKAELNINRNAAVNAAVGERWKSLSEDQQAKYYEQAEEERMLHAQQHPEWSPKDNYGKKKRVQRSTCSTASASKPVQEAQEAKWTSVNVPVCGTFQLPQVNQVLPASDAYSHASTSLASYAGPSQPQTEAIFSDDTGEDLLSIPEHRDPLLPAPQPLEPVCHYSDPHTGPQGDQISPDSPPSTDVSSNVLRIPDRMMQNLRPAGVLKRKRHEQQDEDRPYIKKPPNAFMLFLKEQRAEVKAELNINRNAAVNAAVGERWKSLSEDQQAKYYEQAEEERMLHAQQHPEWSPKDNYGKKKRVQRSTCSTASASKPVQEAQEAKWTSVNVPVCGTFQLPQVNQVLPASDAYSHASTSLASYAGPSQPQTEAIFSDDTGEDLLSIPEHLDPLLPAPQPLEPVCHYSDPHTGPQGDQISPDSPPSTDVSSNVLRIPDRMMQNLRPAGVLKRKRHEQQDEDRPYIKKPPNAFMLFLKEQRAKVKAELNINRNAAVNAAVGERWKSLSEDQQAKYYEQAEEERMLHAQQHPEWSPKDNYGKKKRVQRSTCSTASASKPVQEAQEAKWTSVNVPVCGTFQLPQVNQVLPASDAYSHASTSLASYAGPSQPQTEAIFSDDTGEDLLSIPEHRDPLLPAPQPLEPVCHYSDPHTGPQRDQISPDSPPSTDVSSNVLRIPDRMMQNLRPAGVLKRKRHEQQDEDRPYIKKPPNAFMLFLKEQRAKVKAELNINRNAAVNAAVGERWKSLSEDQQAKYYEQAEEERMLHAQQHPEWSPKDNYGKKKRVQRSTCSTASASKPVQEAQEAKWTSVNVPVCGTFQLPQVNQVLPASDAYSHASTSLASYAGPSQPQTEAIFSDDTGEDLLSIPEHLDPLLPAPQPLEPVCHYSDPHTGPQRDQISPDSPPSTDVNLLYQWPVNGVPTAAAAAATVPLAAPSNTSSNVLRIPDRMMQNLRPAGVLKRKRHEQQDEDRPYIKKPPNAFMLFLLEQRAKVKAELNINRNAAVNAAVGERWKSLSEDQQAKYYVQAEEERMLHAQQHPEWSPKDNYGKKKRVQRSTCSTCKRRL